MQGSVHPPSLETNIEGHPKMVPITENVSKAIYGLMFNDFPPFLAQIRVNCGPELVIKVSEYGDWKTGFV